MKIQIENLRAQMRGVQLTNYQKALALDEYYKLLDYVEELEQCNISNVVRQSEQLSYSHCCYNRERCVNQSACKYPNCDIIK